MPTYTAFTLTLSHGMARFGTTQHGSFHGVNACRTAPCRAEPALQSVAGQLGSVRHGTVRLRNVNAVVLSLASFPRFGMPSSKYKPPTTSPPGSVMPHCSRFSLNAHSVQSYGFLRCRSRASVAAP